MMSARFSAAAYAVASLALCSCRQASASAAAEDTVRVEGDRIVLAATSPQLTSLTTVPATSNEAGMLDVPGRVVWDEDATVRVFVPFAGRVVAIRADAGTVVQTGDTLAIVASPDFGQAEADASRAATDLAQAERTNARTRDLFAHGVVARKDVESADADLRRAQTERKRAWARIAPFTNDTTVVDQLFALRAPLAGVVVDRSISPGQEVRPDQMLANTPQLVAPLFTISNPSRLWVQIDLPERDVPLLRPGTTVGLRTESAAGRAFEGHITWVASSVDPATHTVKARATVANASGTLKSEMLVTVSVRQPAHPGVAVPASAVVFKDGARIVFVDEGGGRLRRCTVSAGAEHNGVVSLDAGLAPGERVVTSGALLLEQLYQATRKS